MDKPPKKRKGGHKNKLGIPNVNHLVNVGRSTEWFILNKISYKNRYLKSFETFEEAYDARNKTYAMFGIELPVDDWVKFKTNEDNFLKKLKINY
tara:strand:+ start:875 stop:1156 length:282 start_codon:yes stop_codon:yes gene_type:complete